ncbi:unnamed protein product [Alopecurus aequalis]
MSSPFSEGADEQSGTGDELPTLFTGDTDFAVDNTTYVEARIRAAFYPKFENDEYDPEIRTQMIEMVSNGSSMEVTLKHSGSLFMYAGRLGGAYSKNSFGNIYTAVGVFVLDRLFREAWGKEAPKMQVEFNDYLENNRINISMELVTAVLGDHGQRPKDDYAVVTAVTDLGHGKPKFYSTLELIAFCRKWRLPTNHVWLFSTRESASSFFDTYDELCEEGTATMVCKALDKIADISLPGSKDHVMVQGEILEGLVARIVSRVKMEEVLRNFSPPPLDGVDSDLGPSLRKIWASNTLNEKQKIDAFLEKVGSSMCPDHSDWLGKNDPHAQSRKADESAVTNFLQAHPTDYATKKLQEMIRLMKQRQLIVNSEKSSVTLKFYQKIDSLSNDKMVIHVRRDSAFRFYQQEMRENQGLWPLYRGFFVDVNLFKANNKKAAEGALDSSLSGNEDGLADEDSNLMVKLKFLAYKMRTFLIRKGLPILFKDGPSAYRNYYLSQMKIWGTSQSKQNELCKLLDKWADYIRGKYGNEAPSPGTYLSEAEPFLEQYAQRDEVDDFEPESAPSSSHTTSLDVGLKTEGLIVFFPGIPGCAKSALCNEILKMPGGLGDSRPLHCLEGDLTKENYWRKVAVEQKEEPFRITLADKNAPKEDVWQQIEVICRSTKAAAVPVIPDCDGTDTNPFSLEALAVFMFRVLKRVNHPGKLDEKSPVAGCVLLMFYEFYDGKFQSQNKSESSRSKFEGEMYKCFGSLVKMPLLKPDRAPLPGDVKSILDKGLSLYKQYQTRRGRWKPSNDSHVCEEWKQWEERLREILFENGDYLKSIQVPFEFAVKEVVEQLKAVAKGDPKTPDAAERRFGNIIYAAVTLSQADILDLVRKVAEKDTNVNNFLKGIKLEDNLNTVHITLAHKRSHGVAAVESYGIYQKQEVPVSFNAFFYNDKMAALEAQLGMVNGETVASKNDWPHGTLWTAAGVAAYQANTLPQLVSDEKAKRVPIDPPITISGVLDFFY